MKPVIWQIKWEYEKINYNKSIFREIKCYEWRKKYTEYLCDKCTLKIIQDDVS